MPVTEFPHSAGKRITVITDERPSATSGKQPTALEYLTKMTSCLPLYLPGCLFICPFVCLSIGMLIKVFVCLFVFNTCPPVVLLRSFISLLRFVCFSSAEIEINPPGTLYFYSVMKQPFSLPPVHIVS